MDEQIVMLTEGSYSDYGVEMHVIGPADCAINDLRASFLRDYVPSRPGDAESEGRRSAWDIAYKRLLEQGISVPDDVHASDYARLFGCWLIARHGFREVAVSVAHFSGWDED